MVIIKSTIHSRNPLKYIIGFQFFISFHKKCCLLLTNHYLKRFDFYIFKYNYEGFICIVKNVIFTMLYLNIYRKPRKHCSLGYDNFIFNNVFLK